MFTFSRRQFLSTAGATLVASGLAACSSQQNQSSQNISTSAQSKGSIYPLTLEMVDGTGEKFSQTFEKKPERVVTLNDSTCEIMLRLGLGDLVVGTVAPDGAMPEDLQNAYSKIAQFGDKKSISREAVVGSNPDVILGRALYFTEDKQLDHKTLNDLGINIYCQQSSTDNGNPTLQGVIDDVKNIAKIFDVEDSAADYIKELEDRLAKLQKETDEAKSDKTPSVIFMANLKTDGTFGLFGVQKGSSLQTNVIEDLGGSMATTQSASGLTFGNLLSFNPDVIVYITADRNKSADETAEDTLYNAAAVAEVPAVANKRLVKVGYAEFMDYTPRLFDSAEKILPVLNSAK